MVPELEFAQQWLNAQQLSSLFSLEYVNNKLTLFKCDEPKLGGIVVDFTSGKLDHRRKFGGGRGEAIAKAVGIKKEYLPTVLDATAGLGQDGFILASLGCNVTLLERHPVVYALLKDGLERAYLDSDIGDWVQNRLCLIHHNSYEYQPDPSMNYDVVYLDPMFPHRTKSALVKKEMRLFQTLVGEDNDADQLLKMALNVAKKRVVVKRPDSADFLGGIITHSHIKTKNHRFDIYAPHQNQP